MKYLTLLVAAVLATKANDPCSKEGTHACSSHGRLATCTTGKWTIVDCPAGQRCDFKDGHSNCMVTANPPAANSNSNAESISGKLVTFDQFKKAVVDSGYAAPTEQQYNAAVNSAPKGSITTVREFAMFLAQIIWESGGLIYKEEINCKASGCPGQYSDGAGVPGKNYFGRGYIQLSWPANYKAASQDLYGNSKILDNPDLVASDETVAWETAFWYWKTRVHIDPNVVAGQFGAATKAINGGLECGTGSATPAKRFAIYEKVLKAFGSTETPNPAGC